MLYGALAACPNCKDFRWHLTPTSYRCFGSLDEWTPCGNVTQQPPRVKFVVPDYLSSTPPFDKYKCKLGHRLFHSAPPAQADASAPMDTSADAKSSTAAAAATAKRPRGPLDGLTIAVIGRLSMAQAKVKEKLEALGATLHTAALGSFVTAALSTQKELDKDSKKVIHGRKKL